MGTLILMWRRVLRAPNYGAVVKAANVWWEAMWQDAHKLGFSPRGLGYTDAPFPLITISNELPHMVVGQYEYSTIKVLGQERMRKLGREYYKQSSKECLAHTILHECQHALDDSRGVDSGDHNKWFYYRLAKMQAAFTIPKGW